MIEPVFGVAVEEVREVRVRGAFAVKVKNSVVSFGRALMGTKFFMRWYTSVRDAPGEVSISSMIYHSNALRVEPEKMYPQTVARFDDRNSAP